MKIISEEETWGTIPKLLIGDTSCFMPKKVCDKSVNGQLISRARILLGSRYRGDLWTPSIDSKPHRMIKAREKHRLQLASRRFNSLTANHKNSETRTCLHCVWLVGMRLFHTFLTIYVSILATKVAKLLVLRQYDWTTINPRETFSVDASMLGNSSSFEFSARFAFYPMRSIFNAQIDPR